MQCHGFPAFAMLLSTLGKASEWYRPFMVEVSRKMQHSDIASGGGGAKSVTTHGKQKLEEFEF